MKDNDCNVWADMMRVEMQTCGKVLIKVIRDGEDMQVEVIKLNESSAGLKCFFRPSIVFIYHTPAVAYYSSYAAPVRYM